MFGTPSISVLTDVISGLTNFSESHVPVTEGAVNKNSKPIIERRGALTCSINHTVIWLGKCESLVA